MLRWKREWETADNLMFILASTDAVDTVLVNTKFNCVLNIACDYGRGGGLPGNVS